MDHNVPRHSPLVSAGDEALLSSKQAAAFLGRIVLHRLEREADDVETVPQELTDALSQLERAVKGLQNQVTAENAWEPLSDAQLNVSVRLVDTLSEQVGQVCAIIRVIARVHAMGGKAAIDECNAIAQSIVCDVERRVDQLNGLALSAIHDEIAMRLHISRAEAEELEQKRWR